MDIRKKVFSERKNALEQAARGDSDVTVPEGVQKEIMHWNRLPGEVAMSPSPKVFRTMEMWH